MTLIILTYLATAPIALTTGTAVLALLTTIALADAGDGMDKEPPF